jgi:CubicO group peptidase (beta-lactamase class C family)
MASMTKPVIGTAVMMMLEEGKVQLGDPVSKYIPEFKDMKVAVLQTPGRFPDNPPKFHTVPAKRSISIRDLAAQATASTFLPGLSK